MARAIKLIDERDFRAGLNLRADSFQLAEGETPNVLNMDLDPRGGFAMRKCVQPINSANLPQTPHSLFVYQSSTGVSQIVAGSGPATFYSTGGGFQNTGHSWTVSSPQRAVTFTDLLYVQNGTDAPIRWNGFTATALTQAFVDDLAAPTGGKMPIANCITAHIGYVWIANTVESSTRYRSRVRWSHPNRPEDWRTNDYIDVDTGRDGDEITGLAPWGDRLMVFKRNSVHMIVGSSDENFHVIPVSQTTGAVSQEAVAVTERAVYWFGWPDGVFMYDGNTVTWLFERLYPSISEGQIPDAYADSTKVGWIGRRLFVSVPWLSSSVNARTFIYDPTLGKIGGWTAYDLGFGPMLEWRRSEETTIPLACGVAPARTVLRIDRDADEDVFAVGGMTTSGTSGSYAWTADSAATSITGDIDIRCEVSLADWLQTDPQTLVAKWEPTGNQKSYKLFAESVVDPVGGGIGILSEGTEPPGDALHYVRLCFEWSANGSSTVATARSLALVAFGGDVRTIRVTMDVDNGAAGKTVVFYRSLDGGATWLDINTVTVGGTTSIFNSTARTTIGAETDNGDTNMSEGTFYSAQVLSGIAGTEVLNPDFADQPDGTTSFVDDHTNTWTVVPDADISLPSGQVDTTYETRWFDGGSAAIDKRWRRAIIVMDADRPATVDVGVYRNYDLTLRKTFNVSPTPSFEEGSGIWGLMEWGTGIWSMTLDGSQDIEKGSSLGRARSVQLRFTGPTPSARWSVNSISLPYRARPLR